MIDRTILRPPDGCKLNLTSESAKVLRDPSKTSIHTLLIAQFRRIHRLAQHLDSQTTRFFEITVLLVILLQQALCACIVGADARGLPTTIVAAGITLIELELTLWVVAGVDERDTKRSKTTMLRITLFHVAQSSHQLFARDVFVVGE